MTPDEPDDDKDTDLWADEEMVAMMGTLVHITNLCTRASKALLDGDPEALAGALGTIMGRAKALREHVWHYTKQEPQP